MLKSISDLAEMFKGLEINAVIEEDEESGYLLSDINGINRNESDLRVESYQPICLEEIENCDEEEDDLPSDLLRLVNNEEKQIQPYKEDLEVLNLGTEEERREVKIGTTITAKTRQNLIKLLQDYHDVFAWSYQDMPGLDTDIVMHRLPIKTECKPVRETLGKGAKIRRGFGKQHQGRLFPITVAEKKDRFGLGFKPNVQQRRVEMRKRQERRKARLKGDETEWEPMTFPPLNHTFKLGGFENPDAAKKEEKKQSSKYGKSSDVQGILKVDS
ncbi:hypothetical protein GQ457_10G018140 [Hibiscus cannabinus]